MTLEKLLHALKKVDSYARTPTFILTIATSLIGTVVGVGYSILVISSPLGYVFASVIALGGFFMDAVIIYNTTKNKKNDATINNEASNFNVKLFLFFAIPANIAGVISECIGSYASVILLGSALSLPILYTSIVAIALGALTATAALLYNLVQTYEVCQRINPSKIQSEEDKPMPRRNPLLKLVATQTITTDYCANKKLEQYSFNYPDEDPESQYEYTFLSNGQSPKNTTTPGLQVIYQIPKAVTR